VQVDPIKPVLKAPGTTRLKVNHDKLLSNFAFQSNLRRYTSVNWKYIIIDEAQRLKVGQCSSTLSNPH
jgi:hypothetical protein